jgi:hypothetical protein
MSATWPVSPHRDHGTTERSGARSTVHEMSQIRVEWLREFVDRDATQSCRLRPARIQPEAF